MQIGGKVANKTSLANIRKYKLKKDFRRKVFPRYANSTEFSMQQAIKIDLAKS